MTSVVITGCNRGLGLGLVKSMVKTTETPKHLIATCRDITKALELQQLAEQHSNVHILELDVRNYKEFNNFSKEVGNIVNNDGLNVLFNNAGCSPSSTRINFVKPEQMMETFQVNTLGPLMLSKALLPLLKIAASKNSKVSMSTSKAAIINMSSSLGSIGTNVEGGIYPYRCSKAALNMVTKSLSIDLRDHGILVTSIHPGWVKTNMGGTRALLEVEDSVKEIVNLLGNLGAAHNGKFFQYDGKELVW